MSQRARSERGSNENRGDSSRRSLSHLRDFEQVFGKTPNVEEMQALGRPLSPPRRIRHDSFSGIGKWG